MPKAPPEVEASVQLDGTNGADILMAVEAVVTALPGYQGDVFVDAFDGDDGIVRDRTGAYSGYDARYGDMQIDGGGGFDVLNYNSADGPITARLDLTWTKVGGVWVQSATGVSRIHSLSLPIEAENYWVRGVDNVRNVEGIAGSVFGDTLHGDGKANRLWGHDGDDVIHGGGGADDLWGGNGDDEVHGGDGNDDIDGGDGEDELYGGKGRDEIHGGDDDDVIWGQQGDDRLYGGDGEDEIRGGDGNDRIYTGDGGDDVKGDGGRDRITLEGFGDKTVDGGAGVDTLIFTQKAVVDLFNGVAWRGESGVEGTDTIQNVEYVTTAGFADVIVGSDVANDVRSGGGADWVIALGGDDRVWAGGGADTVLGGDGDDLIRGEDGADTLHGGDGDDEIRGGHGEDEIRGGAGADELWGDQPLGLASQTPVKDVFVWGEGDVGLDVVHNFSLDHDRLRFEAGFLAAGDVEDNLLMFLDGDDAMLAANVAGHGWDFIARFEHVNGILLWNAIESGSIFDVETTGLGEDGPGGLDTLDLPEPLGVVLGLLL